jgi:5-methylcytosine-specific restriction endonuclease McrA
MPVTVPCSNCGALLRRPSYESRKHAHFFCNASCKGKWQSLNASGPNHPSWKGGGVRVPCSHCQKELLRPASAMKNVEHAFCDQYCYGAWYAEHRSGENSHAWQGGRWGYYYGPNWQRQRAKARKRDAYKCQKCGISEKKLRRRLDVHHVVPFRTFGYVVGENDHYKEANRLMNLVSLCPTCHQRSEKGKLPVQQKLL